MSCAASVLGAAEAFESPLLQGSVMEGAGRKLRGTEAMVSTYACQPFAL